MDRTELPLAATLPTLHTPTLERAVMDDTPSPSESGGSRRGRYVETEKTPSSYRETDKGENIACII